MVTSLGEWKLEFRPVKFHLKIDHVSHPAQVKRRVNKNTQTYSGWPWIHNPQWLKNVDIVAQFYTKCINAFK